MRQKRFLIIALLGYSVSAWASETASEVVGGAEKGQEKKEEKKQDNEAIRRKVTEKCTIAGTEKGLQRRNCINEKLLNADKITLPPGNTQALNF